MRKTECTPFECRVYAVLKTIPKGTVRSYQWVAAKAGAPNAQRAVGNALHKNPRPPSAVGRACPAFSRRKGRRGRPVIVPCHRVVRSDGSLGGFSKGTKAKMRLLEAEGLTVEKIRDIIKSQKGRQ